MSKHRNKHYKRINVCRDCNGNGFVLVDTDIRSLDYEKRICSTCLGSGMVNLEIKHDIN